MSCGVGYRHRWDPELLWLRRRVVATALIQPVAWEPPYAVGVALEKTKRQKKKKKKKDVPHHMSLKKCKLNNTEVPVNTFKNGQNLED